MNVRWWKWSLLVLFAILTVGGGMMLREEPSGSRQNLGLNLLTVGILGVAVSSLWLWLTAGKPGGGKGARGNSSAAPARLVFVIRPDRPQLYDTLKSLLAGQPNVDVVLDRRTRARDTFDREVHLRGWSVARVGG